MSRSYEESTHVKNYAYSGNILLSLPDTRPAGLVSSLTELVTPVVPPVENIPTGERQPVGVMELILNVSLFVSSTDRVGYGGSSPKSMTPAAHPVEQMLSEEQQPVVPVNLQPSVSLVND